eukprot:75739-Heterocapsa_arctica.AAC.1
MQAYFRPCCATRADASHPSCASGEPPHRGTLAAPRTGLGMTDHPIGRATVASSSVGLRNRSGAHLRALS